jgi:1-deoxy-D-xylulose-5-phosphate reductoisomerase
MKRVAVLGAKGSIGRQALAVIDANPGLELAAAASGSQPIDGLAPLTQVGGNPTELLEWAEPDVVLNAIVGFAGVRATLWVPSAGSTSLANKEPCHAASWQWLRASGRRTPAAGRQRAPGVSGAWRAATRASTDRAHRVGRPFGRNRSSSGVTPDDALAHRPGKMVRHRRFTRPNKDSEVIGALSACNRIEVAIQPTSVVHALSGSETGSIRASGLPDMRADLYALTIRAAVEVGPDLASGLTLEFGSSRPTHFAARVRPDGGSGRHLPVHFNAANEVAVATSRRRLPFWHRRGVGETRSRVAVRPRPRRTDRGRRGG